ncbi:4699_t:CDS:2 [Acaulospora colombiana]|uniref:4699_t:CDS:1 n=1 Tax=Acaulospora colombiana TaxID=27376 RepID=A0ACA9KKD9_9GLOM|nr:4699_t:CDS:2 [Acaulospora colombiana]
MPNTSQGWDRDFSRFESTVSNLFDDFFKDLNVARRTGGLNTRGNNASWVPHIDVHETEKDFVVNAELPGVGKEQVNVDVRENVLMISGESAQDPKFKDCKTHIQERRYGQFSRAISLPPYSRSDEITAKFEHGILEVTIPKGEAPGNRKVTVQ